MSWVQMEGVLENKRLVLHGFSLKINKKAGAIREKKMPEKQRLK